MAVSIEARDRDPAEGIEPGPFIRRSLEIGLVGRDVRQTELAETAYVPVTATAAL